MERLDDKGYSLVELLIAIAISSIVLLGLAMFMSTSSNSYKFTNDEVFIQKEAQNSLNLLKNFIMEGKGKDIKIVKNSSDELIGLEILNDSSKKYYYVLYKKSEGKLFYKKKDGSITTVVMGNEYEVNMADDKIDSICKKNNTMSEYLDTTDGFDVKLEKGKYKKMVPNSIDPSIMDEVEVEEVNAVNVVLKLKRGKNTITQKETVAPRNSNE